MRYLGFGIGLLILSSTPVLAEVLEQESSALAVFGEACENSKEGEQNATVRMRATDKACFSAINALPEIINIKDSFDDHDFNVMIYNIVDEYIEDLTTKTTKQTETQVCVEVSGYVTPENIGKAIDETIKTPASEQILADNAQLPSQIPEDESLAISQPTLLSNNEDNVVVLNTIFVRPTEFYNHTQSNSHSAILRKILAQSDNVQIVQDEEDANFVVTPQVLKAKIEPLNNETNRLQMVLALETFDRHKNTTTTEHQNKFVLFTNDDNEQEIAKKLLTQLFEKSSSSLLKLANKSSQQIYQKHAKMLSGNDNSTISQPHQTGAEILDKPQNLN
ncbi:MAG: hypothetical protein IJ660_03860 [Alphaproteobacteria bacterium]|nr:hypothetical protein [Alphaproteobacteria bacterium]